MAFSQDISAVKSEPLRTARAPKGGDWAVGVALFVFGAIGWLSGARYTLFGWVAGLNLFFSWLGLPAAVPVPAGWWVLAMVPIGLVYSRVEMQIWNAHKRHGQALILFAIGWLLIVITDVGSTYLGLRTSPADGAWPITQTIASKGLVTTMTKAFGQ